MPTTTLLTGIDLVDVPRFARVLERRGEKLRERLFTPFERRLPRVESLAARFAAKEAVLKLLGTGLASGMRWHDVEIVAGSRGEPRVVLRGGAAERARTLGVSDIAISLTHTAAVAAASASAFSVRD